MCRFVSYLGNKPLILEELLSKPHNSLINQSRAAKETLHVINADGFGIGWYNPQIDSEPALFKSTQPAWNDLNLKYIATKISSHSFIGHVRASTIGDVHLYNCHPFTNNDYLFAHNGTIRDFNHFKKEFIKKLDNDALQLIQGNSDSEYFFALLSQSLRRYKTCSIATKVRALKKAIQTTLSIQKNCDKKLFTTLNCVLTDGKSMVATRIVSNLKEKPLSLYYTNNFCVSEQGRMLSKQNGNKTKDAIIIASERSSDIAPHWHAVPVNHIMSISEDLEVTFEKIEI